MFPVICSHTVLFWIIDEINYFNLVTTLIYMYRDKRVTVSADGCSEWSPLGFSHFSY